MTWVQRAGEASQFGGTLRIQAPTIYFCPAMIDQALVVDLWVVSIPSRAVLSEEVRGRRGGRGAVDAVALGGSTAPPRHGGAPQSDSHVACETSPPMESRRVCSLLATTDAYHRLGCCAYRLARVSSFFSSNAVKPPAARAARPSRQVAKRAASKLSQQDA